MPFSSVLGSSSVIKPGVCTSSTRPSVPYEGQLIYETDTDRVASYNGSAWVYTATSGLVLIKSQTIGTAVSSVAVTSVFSSTYASYLVVVSNSTGNGNQIGLQIGAAAAGYFGGGLHINSSGTITGYGFGAVSSFTKILNETDGQGYGLYMTIMNPNLAVRTAVVAHGGFGGHFAGVLADATAYTGFTLTTTGTFTGGDIRVYGYANS